MVLRFGPLALLVVCAGCGMSGPPGLPGSKSPPCALDVRYYRISSLTFPSTLLEAAEAGLNLDPPTEDPDNFLGIGRGGMVQQGVVFSTDGSSQALARWPWVAAVGTCSGEAYAQVAFLRGLDVPAPGMVRVESPPPMPAVGTAGDRLSASDGTGSIPLSLFFEPDNDPADVAWVDSLGLAVDLVVTDAELSGTLGFGVLQDDAVEAIREPLSRAFNLLISADSGCPSACVNSLAGIVLGWFDKNADGALSPDELDDNWFRSYYAGCDVDLVATVNGKEVYWPAHDKEYDHTSMALQIEGTRVEVVP